MEGEIRRTEELPAGRTSFDLSGALRGTSQEGFLGVNASLRSHFERDKLAFLTGAIGHKWGDEGSRLYYELLAGFRWKF